MLFKTKNKLKGLVLKCEETLCHWYDKTKEDNCRCDTKKEYSSDCESFIFKRG